MVAAELLVATLGEERGFWYFAEPRDSALPAPELDVTVSPAEEGAVDVTLAARTFARDVTLLVDKAAPDAVAERALVTLLPGESTTVRVRGLPADADAESFAERLADPRVRRSAGQLV